MEVQAKNIRSLLCARFTFKSEEIIIVAMKNGLVAQLGERTVRIRKAEGSIPFESTKEESHPSGGFLLWYSIYKKGDRKSALGGVYTFYPETLRTLYIKGEQITIQPLETSEQ